MQQGSDHHVLGVSRHSPVMRQIHKRMDCRWALDGTKLAFIQHMTCYPTNPLADTEFQFLRQYWSQWHWTQGLFHCPRRVNLWDQHHCGTAPHSRQYRLPDTTVIYGTDWQQKQGCIFSKQPGGDVVWASSFPGAQLPQSALRLLHGYNEVKNLMRLVLVVLSIGKSCSLRPKFLGS